VGTADSPVEVDRAAEERKPGIRSIDGHVRLRPAGELDAVVVARRVETRQDLQAARVQTPIGDAAAREVACGNDEYVDGTRDRQDAPATDGDVVEAVRSPGKRARGAALDIQHTGARGVQGAGRDTRVR